MTLDPKAIVLSWRAEIAAELEAATKALPPLVASHEAASAAADEAAADNRALLELLGKAQGKAISDFLGITQFLYLEGPLGLRAREYADRVDQARSLRARTLGELEAAREKVRTLRRALAQLDLIVPPADESLEAA